MSPREYAKGILAVLGAGVTASLGIWTSGDVYNGLTIASAVLTAALVVLVPNKAAAPSQPDGYVGEHRE